MEVLALVDSGSPQKFSAKFSAQGGAANRLGHCVEVTTQEWGEDNGNEVWLSRSEVERLHEWLSRWLEAHP